MSSARTKNVSLRSMGIDKRRASLNAPGVEAALASICVFLKRIGLSATVRALASEIERKGGNKHVVRQKQGGDGAASPLDRLLHAALDAECDETSMLAALALGAEGAQAKANGCCSSVCEVQEQAARTAPLVDAKIVALSDFRPPTRRDQTLAARLRNIECGERNRARKDMEICADKLRISRCEPVAVLRGHREPLVNLEILSNPAAGAPCAEYGGADGPLIFSASLDNTLRLWSVGRGTGDCQAVLRAPGQKFLRSLLYSGFKEEIC